MSDQIRAALEEAAGPLDETIDVDALLARDRLRRRRERSVGAALVAALAIAVPWGSWFGDEGVGVRPIVEPVGGSDVPSPDRVPGPADGVVIRLVFSGEDGPDGCRYIGPERLVAGAYPLEFENTSSAPAVGINVDEIRPGLTYEDYLGIVDVDAAATPVVTSDPRFRGGTDNDVPPGGTFFEGGEPRDEGWNAGGFRTVASTKTAPEVLHLVPGTFAVRCFARLDASRVALWPAGGPITVEPHE